MATRGGTVYVIGGWNGVGIGLPTNEAYKVAQDAWTAGLLPMPTPSAETGAVGHGGRIYIVGAPSQRLAPRSPRTTCSGHRRQDDKTSSDVSLCPPCRPRGRAKRTDSNENLRAKGFEIGESYVQAGVGQTGGVLYYVVSGVAMTWSEVVALDEGLLTLGQIAAQRRGVN